MKAVCAFFSILMILQAQAQDNILGRYKDYFGSDITLNADSTFAYSYHFDMAGTWTVGTYKVVNDTIYLTEVPIYDTLQFVNKLKQPIDSLILSDDKKPDRITMDDFINKPFLSSAQDRMSHPLLLVWRKNRLYTLDRHGRLNARKMKAISNGKKYVPWYLKEG